MALPLLMSAEDPSYWALRYWNLRQLLGGGILFAMYLGLDWRDVVNTLRETNIAPENGGFQ